MAVAHPTLPCFLKAFSRSPEAATMRARAASSTADLDGLVGLSRCFFCGKAVMYLSGGRPGQVDARKPWP